MCFMAVAALSGAGLLLLVVIEVLRFGFDQALFPLNACPASKEGNVEAVRGL